MNTALSRYLLATKGEKIKVIIMGCEYAIDGICIDSDADGIIIHEKEETGTDLCTYVPIRHIHFIDQGNVSS